MSQRPSVFIGIDPGKSGGIAVLWGEDCGEEDTPQNVALYSMPDDEMGIWYKLYQLLIVDTNKEVGKVAVAIEQVQGYIGEAKEGGGGGEQPGSTMFKFGQNYGSLRMAVIACGVNPVDVTPQVWQRSMNIDSRRKSETQSKWKNRLKFNAYRLFPDVLYPNLKITKNTSDALMIALYLKRKVRGEI